MPRWGLFRLRRRSRRALAAAAALAGLALMLSALPGWLWAAAAGAVLLAWGLAQLAE